MVSKINIDTTPNKETDKSSSLMMYPRCLNRLSVCEVVNVFATFTGRDSRNPSGV